MASGRFFGDGYNFVHFRATLVVAQAVFVVVLVAKFVNHGVLLVNKTAFWAVDFGLTSIFLARGRLSRDCCNFVAFVVANVAQTIAIFVDVCLARWNKLVANVAHVVAIFINVGGARRPWQFRLAVVAQVVAVGVDVV